MRFHRVACEFGGSTFAVLMMSAAADTWSMLVMGDHVHPWVFAQATFAVLLGPAAATWSMLAMGDHVHPWVFAQTTVP